MSNATVPAWSDEDVEAFRDLANTFMTKECAPNEERWAQQQHIDRETWRKAGELGLLCPSVPEEYGGGGGSFAHEAVMMEEQARTLSPSLGTSVHSTIVAHYLNAYGTEEQKRAWLPRMATGELVGAVAMTEPGTGSDLQSVTTKAIRTGDGADAHYVLDGAKTFITNGYLANLIVVVAKTDPADRAKGISLIVVETDDADGADGVVDGFSRGRILRKIGMHGQDTAELFFDGVRVPAANLLGTEEGQGFVQLMQQLPQERLAIAVAAVAAIEVSLEHTLRYTKERHAFGRPVFAFQNSKFKLAEMATTAKIARVFLDDCIAKHVAGDLDIPTASMAKWWTTQMQCDVADECLQLFGGYGYMQEYPISRMFTDSRIQKIYGGTNEIMKEIISRFL
ncbi:acyl-CoA dehydrogenase [Jatrophihabitans endophyticus]|uniref:Acyl-CoA dehydrogenase n=1 Tax=Jatrophihabitans endophyticus TaxID=1206085 RepID=A0A1M5D822_9ACTN|nr:acyl-CoA dehydrogenase family protein [Jatrophihabitans endophyticus]SHF63156.1 acyl-CoA dehydrogenase [Jatrophihabitans endophyticus]